MEILKLRLILLFCSISFSFFSMSMTNDSVSTPSSLDAISQTQDKGYTVHGEIMLFVIVSIFAIFLLCLLFYVYLRRFRRRRKEEFEDDVMGGLHMREKATTAVGSVNFAALDW
ncbi:hypothetical protein KFK09_012693 [Dendrobium nobile]|uniref:Uncharacterized protein n=1 Tax=Dendrobium nobile TaxID=94219 RepID=A0A8T3BLJ0_DENNO|nr:hypothetical protein KFK09_012693 [Dendrobium nobile]